MNFHNVLEKYRSTSFSERDKGERFERLMQAYLLTSPLYEGRFQHVWMWRDCPYIKMLGGKDTGIDLVAETVEGEYWAIQCKCWDEKSTIDKPAVDSFLATSSKFFTGENGKNTTFAARLWISTTNKWGAEAENAIRHQQPPVMRINLLELEESPVDWGKLEHGISGAKAREKKKSLRDHQKTALDAFHDHFKSQERGKLIMACGTGKTFTSLKIAEKEAGAGGRVLFLVPSIALLGQTLQEWMAEASTSIFPICVCSDPGTTKRKVRDGEDGDGFSVEDLALPASTNVPNIVRQLKNAVQDHNAAMTVVFSTYQSIEVVAAAQKEFMKNGGAEFDLIICDEAHRTTGVTLKDDDDSAFVKVHDNAFIKGRKRLYMTATPRLYNESSKEKAKESEAYLCSMDDEVLYGPEVYRIGFGEAVDRKLLSDYKVLVLTLKESQIPAALQKAIADRTKEIDTDDASKLIGCINALSKRMLVDEGLLRASDPGPMRTAVAFCQNIRLSKKITSVFNEHKEDYYNSLTQQEREELVGVSADHVDGSMAATTRGDKLSWLKNAPADGNECRILTNVRCLSEGVDVPSLDAVMFLSARNSQVDVVQSVGRVMRIAPGKKYGYIIIPVVIPTGVSAEEALDDNKRFSVVWTVLNALRAHDDRFNAMINKLELNKRRPQNGGTVLIGGVGGTDTDGDEATGGKKPVKERQLTLPLPEIQQLQNVIYARMVQKVGNKRYWEQWAADVAKIAQGYITRINGLISQDGPHKTEFNKFLADLRKNINPSVSSDEVVEMLAQHMITKPVFEALFENYSFVDNNPVSLALQNMVDLLETQALEKDAVVLTRFYESVKQRVAGIDNGEGRQRVMIELYDKFFQTAFPKTVERLGIVYTPVEVVDFINKSVADVLKREFGRSLSDENVHIIDPFTGTGTFIARLIQSGLLPAKSLTRKYGRELHANEIVLLAYYIASINIENAYHEAMGENADYQPFSGICLTDTFQLGETDDANLLFASMLPQNSKRVAAQKKAPIRIIIGNPPYSVGQKSANDNAQNQPYPKLERRIAETYAAGSTATLKNSLYDSYIKAFRWSTDRLDKEHGGVIAFVSNAGWLDGNAMDGFRICLENDFSAIYVFNLRGNARTQGEIRRKEKDNVFGMGTRTPVAITLLVRNPQHTGKAVIHYHDIGDYLSREEKLAIVARSRSVLSSGLVWETITPNEHGDWLNQRNDIFGSFIPLGDKTDKNNRQTVFVPLYSNGLKTNRDAWCYNSSKDAVVANMNKTIGFYNAEVERFAEARENNTDLEAVGFIKMDSKSITWDAQQKIDVAKGKKYQFSMNSVIPCTYRPFQKQWGYFNRDMNNRVYQLPSLFPTPAYGNVVITVAAGKNDFPLIVDVLPDLHLNGDAQCFPLYYYEDKTSTQKSLFDKDSGQYIRRDGITDFILTQCRSIYSPKVTKEDVFYYVYGLLHSPEYRTRFAADLKKMLPRLPLVDKPAGFWAFSKAGRDLAALHLTYEDQPPCPDITVTGEDSGNFRVEKMRFVDKSEKSVIEYNHSIRIANIPPEAHRYVLNGRSPIEWIVERYQIRTDKTSGIRNDPNDWGIEHNNPRYILDLILSVATVSVKTMEIIDGLPKLNWEG